MVLGGSAAQQQRSAAQQQRSAAQQQRHSTPLSTNAQPRKMRVAVQAPLIASPFSPKQMFGENGSVSLSRHKRLTVSPTLALPPRISSSADMSAQQKLCAALHTKKKRSVLRCELPTSIAYEMFDSVRSYWYW